LRDVSFLAVVQIAEVLPPCQAQHQAGFLLDPLCGCGRAVLERPGQHRVDDQAAFAGEADGQELAPPLDFVQRVAGQIGGNLSRQ